ncbi:FAD:protein FMN transferase [Parabacteroides bouchesdurhonensis]|uniref:FAD:protein FMN transferase n=1 Tax=Parabacteroides bouchesdurhonensis TaxID=1936995 RepID=UPI000C825E57|nr:FAD:protein FMN transferase [Parabacteroides bouchesdurhonensis]
MFNSKYYAPSGMLHGSSPRIMGTKLDALLIGGNQTVLEDAWNEATAKIERLHNQLNCFDPESAVSRINREAFHAPVPLDDELWNILVDCQRYNTLTEGYFDITLSDFNKVQLSEATHTISFLDEGISIDLGGYGKGYALQKMQSIFQFHGIEKALVNFGNSSVLAIGSHPHGDYWPVGIENPYTHETVYSVKLFDSSLSTSGNSPQHPEHIKNPLTGEYVSERKIVSIVSANPVDAEILTTALMVAPSEQIESILQSFDIQEKYIYNILTDHKS